MCGIAGVVGGHLRREATERLLVQMLPGIESRGPDGQGRIVDDGFGAIHTRLAIIDLTTGEQPIWNERRTVGCVFNGEIYNYRELAGELTAKGHLLATQSDTEVLVHLYEDHGVDLFRRIRGMYAFAIYDAERRAVLVGRDRLGLKPLYLAQIGGATAFASSIASLVAAGADSEVDATALTMYLRFGKVPEPRTIHRGIRTLAPGHYALLDVATGDACVRPSSCESRPAPPRDVVERVGRARRELDRAVADHMIADVEVGAFLSGGIDSSLVVALAQRATGKRLRTFCASFAGAGADVDEARFASKVAQALGTRHETLVVWGPPAQLLRDAVGAAQQPFAVASFLPLLLLCREASKRVKVVLTGDGGDEVGFGYPWYRWMRGASRIPRIDAPRAERLLRALEAQATGWRLVRRGAKFVRGAIAGGARGADAWRYELTPDDACALVRADLRPPRPDPGPNEGAWDPAVDDVEALRRADLHVLLRDEMLPKLDRAGMAFGLEGRPPLLDEMFVKAMLEIPAAAHLSDPRGKAVLRRWAGEVVPGIDAERPKHGFDVPIRSWLETSLREDVDRLLLNPSPSSLLDRAEVSSVWNRAMCGSPGAAHAVYAMLMLELWREARK